MSKRLVRTIVERYLNEKFWYWQVARTTRFGWTLNGELKSTKAPCNAISWSTWSTSTHSTVQATSDSWIAQKLWFCFEPERLVYQIWVRRDSTQVVPGVLKEDDIDHIVGRMFRITKAEGSVEPFGCIFQNSSRAAWVGPLLFSSRFHRWNFKFEFARSIRSVPAELLLLSRCS